MNLENIDQNMSGISKEVFEGAEAYKKGIKTNPYPKYTKEFDHWDWGWSESQNADEYYTNLKMNIEHFRLLDESMRLLENATEFFGPCWCKKSLNYTCPQCYWREEYKKLKKQIKFDTKGGIINNYYE